MLKINLNHYHSIQPFYNLAKTFDSIDEFTRKIIPKTCQHVFNDVKLTLLKF